MGVEFYICCEDCKVYYHLGKNYYNDMPVSLWHFLFAHKRHRIWPDVDVSDRPVFCLEDYKEVKSPSAGKEDESETQPIEDPR
jgi:hypothetical protein